MTTSARTRPGARATRPFLDWPGPIAFAHRGGAGDHPENTVPAFASAVALGFRYLETDVHCSRDGVVFAFHDDVLDRVTDRTGRISAMVAAEVEAADAGYQFTPDSVAFPWRGRGVRVPRLEEILTTWPHVRVNIDPKTDAVVEPLMQLLHRLDALDRICVGSFSDARIVRVRRLGGDQLCTSMGPRAVAAARASAWCGRIARLGADCIQIPLRTRGVRLVDHTMVRAAHAAALQVHVWTIDDARVMRTLLDLGVDGIMTDRPAVLRSVLVERNEWYE